MSVATLFRSHSLLTPSVTLMLSCNCFVENGQPSGGTEIIEDRHCGTSWGLTTDMHFVWAKGGRASLTCTIHPEDEPQP